MNRQRQKETENRQGDKWETEWCKTLHDPSIQTPQKQSNLPQKERGKMPSCLWPWRHGVFALDESKELLSSFPESLRMLHYPSREAAFNYVEGDSVQLTFVCNRDGCWLSETISRHGVPGSGQRRLYKDRRTRLLNYAHNKRHPVRWEHATFPYFHKENTPEGYNKSGNLF